MNMERFLSYMDDDVGCALKPGGCACCGVMRGNLSRVNTAPAERSCGFFIRLAPGRLPLVAVSLA